MKQVSFVDIEELDFANTKELDDDTLEIIAFKFPLLRKLDISRSAVTKRGVLEHVTKLPHLDHLRIENSLLNWAERDEVEERLPKYVYTSMTTRYK